MCDNCGKNTDLFAHYSKDDHNKYHEKSIDRNAGIFWVEIAVQYNENHSSENDADERLDCATEKDLFADPSAEGYI